MSSREITEPGGPAVVHETDTYRIKSRRVGADFEIRVARPLPSSQAELRRTTTCCTCSMGISSLVWRPT